MSRRDALRALERAVEAGTAMNGDFADAFPVTGPSKPYWVGTSAYNNRSLDAAKAMHDAMLPGWDLSITTYEDGLFEVSVSEPLAFKTYDGLSEIISHAWLLAIIRALIAQEGGE